MSNKELMAIGWSFAVFGWFMIAMHVEVICWASIAIGTFAFGYRDGRDAGRKEAAGDLS